MGQFCQLFKRHYWYNNRISIKLLEQYEIYYIDPIVNLDVNQIMLEKNEKIWYEK